MPKAMPLATPRRVKERPRIDRVEAMRGGLASRREMSTTAGAGRFWLICKKCLTFEGEGSAQGQLECGVACGVPCGTLRIEHWCSINGDGVSR